MNNKNEKKKPGKAQTSKKVGNVSNLPSSIIRKYNTAKTHGEIVATNLYILESEDH